METCTCMLCNRGGFLNLGPHITRMHDMTLEDYRSRFPDTSTVSDSTKKLTSEGQIAAHIRHTPEEEAATKRKISQTLMGHEVSPETRAKMSEVAIGNSNAMGPHVYDGSRNAYNAEYYKRNRDRIIQRAHDYYQEHPEDVLTYHQLYFEDHPEVPKKASHKRRALEVGADGLFTEEDFRELCRMFEHRCAYCGQDSALVPDHMMPLSRGGSNYIDNKFLLVSLVIALRELRQSKSFLG